MARGHPRSIRCGRFKSRKDVAVVMGFGISSIHFFEGAIMDPTFEEMDDISRTPDISQKNWVPENGQKYLYYNIHGRGPNRIHFPVFFWFLMNSPKIVHLTRGDHLTRAISIFFMPIKILSDIILDTGDEKFF